MSRSACVDSASRVATTAERRIEASAARVVQPPVKGPMVCGASTSGVPARWVSALSSSIFFSRALP